MKSLSEVTMKNAIVDIACYIAWGPLFLIVEFYSKKQQHGLLFCYWHLCKFSDVLIKEHYYY